MLLAVGRESEGQEMLAKAFEAASEASLLCYYKYTNGPEPGDALSRLKRLMQDGARSTGWDFSENIARARQDGHGNIALLEDLADVIAEDADISILDQHQDWLAA